MCPGFGQTCHEIAKLTVRLNSAGFAPIFDDASDVHVLLMSNNCGYIRERTFSTVVFGTSELFAQQQQQQQYVGIIMSTRFSLTTHRCTPETHEEKSVFRR